MADTEKTIEELQAELAASKARTQQLEDALAAHNAAVATPPKTAAPPPTAGPIEKAPGTCSLRMNA